MTRTSRSAYRTAKTTDPGADPVGAFLVRQRPEVTPGGKELPRPTDATERITDPNAISSLLASVSNLSDGAEDDLIFELLYLETLIAARPLKSSELLEQLGALGDEVREGLLPPGMINMVALRRRTRRLQQHLGGMASRVSAAILMLFTTMPLFGQQAAAAETDASMESFQIAAAPVVRVIDANTGAGLAGVTIKSMEEKVLGVTDANGQATLAEDYRDTDLMSLEKSGYELSLLERSQLAARNIVSMKPLKDEPAMAHAPTAPKPAAPKPPAVKPPTAPHVAMGANHQPVLEAPRPPVAPKAPQIRLPAKPRASAAPLASRVHAPAKPAAKPNNMVASLPTHPKPPQAEMAPKGSQMAAAPKTGPSVDAPVLPRPHVEKPAAKPMARPQLPVVHEPAKPTMAHVPAGAAAGAAATMSLPSHPRKPMTTASKPMSLPSEPVAVAVPKRVPKPVMAHSTAQGHHHGHGRAAMASAAGRSLYQVKPGDSLSKLAKRYLGSARRWPELYAMNRGRVHNPALIRVGQVLSLPSGGAMMAGRGRAYVVKPGDSLYKIAGQQMGNGARWSSIYELNKGHIRDARMIFPGQRLYLPV